MSKNINSLYFVQTVAGISGKRHAWLVSSPHFADAVVEVQDKWCGDDESVVHAERVLGLVDTDETMSGKTYIKIHN